MDGERLSRYSFIVFLFVLIYLGVLLAKPFFSYIVLALVFAFAFRPVYNWLFRITKNKNLSATVLTILIILLCIIPIFFIIISLINQTSSALDMISSPNEFYEKVRINDLSQYLSERFHRDIDVREYIKDAFTKVTTFIIESKGPSIFSSLIDLVIGMFIMFFIMFYILRGGNEVFEEIQTLIPLKKKYKIKLFAEIESLGHAVLYGQVLTAVIQGSLGGLGLYVAGVPNALFWTLIMILFAFIPFTGTPLVFVPAGIYLFLDNRSGAAIGLLIYSFVIVMNIDNIIKPRLIGTRSKLHPVLILIGVFGGLKLFGFIGIIVGPLIMALLILFLRLYASDFQADAEAKVES
ncbi:MAG: AI-2E family transporter [Nanoarchaeota archaeon]